MNDKQLRILLYFVILLLGVIIPFIVYNIVKDKRNKNLSKKNSNFMLGFLLSFLYIILKAFASKYYFNFIYKNDLIRICGITNPFFDYVTSAIIAGIIFIIVFTIKNKNSKMQSISDNHYVALLNASGFASGIFLFKMVVMGLENLNRVCLWKIDLEYRYFITNAFVSHPIKVVMGIDEAWMVIVKIVVDVILLATIVLLTKDFVLTKKINLLLKALGIEFGLYIIELALFLLHNYHEFITCIIEIGYIIFIVSTVTLKEYKRLKNNSHC